MRADIERFCYIAESLFILRQCELSSSRELRMRLPLHLYLMREKDLSRNPLRGIAGTLKEVLLHCALHFHKGIVAEIEKLHKRFRQGKESTVRVMTRYV
jgi:hypothetical protein